MTDSLEAELRTTLQECAGLMPADAALRLAAVEYWPRVRRTPKRRRFWSVASTIGVAVAGCAVAAVLLFSSSSGGPLGVPMAYAGWSATPSLPSPTAVTKAVARCNAANTRTGQPQLTGQPVLTDARGRYTAALFVIGEQTYDCISDGTFSGTGTGGTMIEGSYLPPGPDQLGLPGGGGGSARGFPGADPNAPMPAQFQRILDRPWVKNNPTLLARMRTNFRRQLATGVETHLYGQAGSDIASVILLFADRTTVDATVQNGWYFAWWPTVSSPIAVRATTTGGTTITSRMNCKTAAANCVFAGNIPPPKGQPTMAPAPPAGVPTRTTLTTAATTTTAGGASP